MKRESYIKFFVEHLVKEGWPMEDAKRIVSYEEGDLLERIEVLRDYLAHKRGFSESSLAKSKTMYAILVRLDLIESQLWRAHSEKKELDAIIRNRSFFLKLKIAYSKCFWRMVNISYNTGVRHGRRKFHVPS